MKKEVVTKEVALAEFDMWAEAMDLETEELQGDDLEGFEKHKSVLVRAIRAGNLTVNDEGLAVYQPCRTELDAPLVFHERTGASLMASDKVKNPQALAARMYAVLADLTKVPAVTFAKLKGPDIKVCESLFALLMG